MSGRRASWAALAGVLALATLAPAHGEAVRSTPIAAGVTHEVWPVAGSSARVHVARVAAGAPVQLQVVQAGGGLVGGRETTTALCRRTAGCVAALNGDFFTADGPVGAVVVGGRMLRSPRPGHEQLSVSPLRATADGFGAAGWAGSIASAQGEPVPLDGVNVGLGAGQVVLYTADHGAATPPCTCTELVLAEGRDRAGRLDRPVAVTATGRGGGRTPLSPGTVVVAGEGAGAARVTALADATHASPEARRLAVTVAVAQRTVHNLGAHPVLLRDGQVMPVDEADPMLAEPHPRSVVAWDARSGTVWLLAFDGRQPGGGGPTWRDVVGFLQRLGASDAAMLDGGGSTTLARPDGPLNLPSDEVERPVSNAVVLVAEPGAAPPTAAPVAAAAAVPAQPVPPAVVAAPPPLPAPPPPAPVAAAPAPVRAKPAAVPRAAPARSFPRAGLARAAVERPVPAPDGRRLTQPPLPPPAADPLAVPAAAALVLLAAAAWPHAARRRTPV